MPYSFLEKNKDLDEIQLHEKLLQKKIDREQLILKKKECSVVEGRKRNQIDLATNYIFRKTTLFHYCSGEVLKLFYHAQLFAIIDKTPILPFHLLLAFLKRKGPLKEMFFNYKIRKRKLYFYRFRLAGKTFQEIDSLSHPTRRDNFQTDLQEKWKNWKSLFFFFLNPEVALRNQKNKKKTFTQLFETIDFHPSCYEILDTAMENSLERFKICWVTPEILLLTILENKHCTASLIMKKFFKKKLERLVFRFKYLKLLYEREIKIRHSLTCSEYYILTIFQFNIADRGMRRLARKPKRFSKLGLRLRRETISSAIKFKRLRKKIRNDIFSETRASSLKTKFRKIFKKTLANFFDRKQVPAIKYLLKLRRKKKEFIVLKFFNDSFSFLRKFLKARKKLASFQNLYQMNQKKQVDTYFFKLDKNFEQNFPHLKFECKDDDQFHSFSLHLQLLIQEIENHKNKKH